MVGEPSQFPSCAICGRTILRGERVSEYVAPDGEPTMICALCKPRAEASGWIPADQARDLAHAAAPRRRRAINLRERFARVSEAAGTMLARREPNEAGPPVDGPTPHAADSEPDEGPAEPPSPERTMRLAIEAFNSSAEARKVAGLLRSLGEPKVTVRAAESEPGSTFVTVAWELSWYRWEISDAGEVRELDKGGELDELDDSDRAWNAGVGTDGTVRLGAGADREPVEG